MHLKWDLSIKELIHIDSKLINQIIIPLLVFRNKNNLYCQIVAILF